MDDALQDLRFSLRQLFRNPGFSVVAILVLALGIGAATSIFSVLDTLVIRALPYQDAERIVTIWENDVQAGIERDDVAPGNYLDWQEQSGSFEFMSALDPYSLDLRGDERPEVVFAARVTRDFFRAFGTVPAHGRGFTDQDFADGKAVVLSHNLWERRFASDETLIGSAIDLDGEPYTVIGILPKSFDPYLHPTVRDREAWIPLTMEGWERSVRGSRFWNVVAKLRPGVSASEAGAEMDAIAARLAADYPETNATAGISIVPIRDHLVGSARTALFILQGAVIFLLLIACANVGSLLLARGTERAREFAIRSALGAGRKRLVRQLLTESVILGLVGAGMGVLLAFLGADLITALGPAEIPRIDEVAVDGRVLVFAVGLAGATALLFGIIPALHFSRPDLQSSMKDGRTSTAGVSRRRIRGAMVVAEVALSLVLVVGAGLLARSFVSLLGVDPGFDRGNVAVAQVFRYVDDESREERLQFFEESLDRIRALPGVQSAAIVSAMPFIEANIAIQQTFHIEGRAEARPGDAPNAYLAIASEDYFATLRIPLLAGRVFTPTDVTSGIPVVVVTDALAGRFWPGENPVGQRMRIGDPPDEGDQTVWEVVGVVGQVRHESLDRDPRPEVFVPMRQANMGSLTFVARTEADAAAYLERIQQEVWAVDPLQTFYRTATLDELVARSMAARRFNLWLLGSFAIIALVLAAVGIYGVISYQTRTRTHEIGVRMALGAGQTDVLGQVMSRGLKLTGLGIAIGIVGSLGLTRLMSSLLFGISSADPLTFVGVALLLAAVALLATYLPARRATEVDPSVALRVE